MSSNLSTNKRFASGPSVCGLVDICSMVSGFLLGKIGTTYIVR